MPADDVQRAASGGCEEERNPVELVHRRVQAKGQASQHAVHALVRGGVEKGHYDEPHVPASGE